MEPDPRDALHIDDSDLPTFIRPCQRRSNPSSSSRPLISGPAGTVQAAMIHRTTIVGPHLPTVEFVRRTLGDPNPDKDPDFHSNAWLSALEVCRSATPVCAITHRLERADHVVDVVKSFTPNGFGDATVSLKDPTGTIGASIHRKVFTEAREFGNDITVGSVLVLEQVTVFSPRNSMCYLNITLPNIVKAFPKDLDYADDVTDITGI